MHRPPRHRHIIYAGTYERDYPRNATVVAALRRAGFVVREIHQPVWELVSDKTRPVGLRSRFGVMAALLSAYPRLVARLMLSLRSADALVIGYIGQCDMLVLGPVARIMRRPVVFNPLVTLTDTIVEDRMLVREGSLAAQLIRWIDRAALMLADRIFVDTLENGRYLVERFGVPCERIAVVPVGADERVFRPSGGLDHGGAARLIRNATVCELDILFYGKMIPLHGAETIIRTAAMLAEEGGFRFTLVGSGQTLEATRSLAAELRADNVRFIPWVPYERLAQAMEQADVILGIFGDSAKAGRVVPNKVYQAMVMGAAIVTRDSPAIRHVLKDGVSAMLVPPADPPALAGALRRLRDPRLRAELGAAARSAFLEYASLDAQAEALRRALEPLSGGREARLVTRASK